MALAFKTISSPGTYAGLQVASLDVAADDVTLEGPMAVSVPLGANGLPLDLYGIEEKKRPLLAQPIYGAYYGGLSIIGSGYVSGARNKGILAPGKRGLRIFGNPLDPFVIRHCGQDGIDVSGDNCHIEGVSISDLGILSWDDDGKPHGDGLDINGGSGVVSQCRIDLSPAPGRSANANVYIESDQRVFTAGGWHFNSCELIGGDVNYALFIHAAGKYGPPKFVRVFNTTLKRGRFGWLNYGDNHGSTWAPVNLPPWLDVDMRTCKFI